MQKNRRGFIFTIDAVSAAAFLVVLLSVAFVVVNYKPALTHTDAHFAPDVLAALDNGQVLDDTQVRQLFLQANRCGSIVVREAGAEGKVIDAAYACGCPAGKESVAYRSFVRQGAAGELQVLMGEAKVCERSGA
ncbi:MAG: hypothetical protein Q7T16_01540 [Candidatus Burarchaeum sp.]|nr:hypothetical protein [Candidatus Burarchaeum sp.]MDO8339319.1 hypothetical protein [Candidatus Burarchaeum sp.]